MTPNPNPDSQGAQEKAKEAGSPNYPLFIFFAETHGLTLLDSEIEEIIDRVIEFDKNRKHKEYVLMRETVLKNKWEKRDGNYWHHVFGLRSLREAYEIAIK